MQSVTEQKAAHGYNTQLLVGFSKMVRTTRIRCSANLDWQLKEFLNTFWNTTFQNYAWCPFRLYWECQKRFW